MKAKRKYATAASIAPIEFEAIEDLAAMSKQERGKAAHSMIDDIHNQTRPFLLAAGEVLAIDKKGLIALVSEHPELWGDILVEIAHARDTLKAVQDSMGAAEMRLMIALSNVAGEKTAA
jgi:hypothetical protein